MSQGYRAAPAILRSRRGARQIAIPKSRTLSLPDVPCPPCTVLCLRSRATTPRACAAASAFGDLRGRVTASSRSGCRANCYPRFSSASEPPHAIRAQPASSHNTTSSARIGPIPWGRARNTPSASLHEPLARSPRDLEQDLNALPSPGAIHGSVERRPMPPRPRRDSNPRMRSRARRGGGASLLALAQVQGRVGWLQRQRGFAVAAGLPTPRVAVFFSPPFASGCGASRGPSPSFKGRFLLRSQSGSAPLGVWTGPATSW